MKKQPDASEWNFDGLHDDDLEACYGYETYREIARQHNLPSAKMQLYFGRDFATTPYRKMRVGFGRETWRALTDRNDSMLPLTVESIADMKKQGGMLFQKEAVTRPSGYRDCFANGYFLGGTEILPLQIDWNKPDTELVAQFLSVLKAMRPSEKKAAKKPKANASRRRQLKSKLKGLAALRLKRLAGGVDWFTRVSQWDCADLYRDQPAWCKAIAKAEKIERETIAGKNCPERDFA